MIKKLIIILAISISIILSGCGKPPDVVTYRAFVTGAEDYLYFSTMDLTSAGYNVERLKEIFSLCKFTEDEIEFSVINTLRHKEATKKAILDGIVSTFGEADENDISYFYFMGHGGVRDGQPIFCPTDYTGAVASTITLKELETTFDKIKGTKILFFESCHSGNFIEKGNNYLRNFNRLIIGSFDTKAFNKGNYKVITSCKGEQTCWTSGTMSYFTMGVYQGCKDLKADTDKDKIVNLSELYKYTIDWVDDHICSCKDQDAQMYPEGSTFPIVEY